MLNESIRWQRVWWFLSLSVVKDLSRELWLPTSIMNLQEQVRSRIDIERDLPTYGIDPRQRAYLGQLWFADAAGEDSLDYLWHWQNSVFAQGGQDRIEEFIWEKLSYEILYRHEDLGLSEDSYLTLSRFREMQAISSSLLMRKMKSVTVSALSTWDRNAIEAEGETPDDAINSIINISSSNIFVRCWSVVCTRTGIGFLEEVSNAAIRILREDASGSSLCDESTVPFPSSWEFRFRKMLKLSGAP